MQIWSLRPHLEVVSLTSDLILQWSARRSVRGHIKGSSTRVHTKRAVWLSFRNAFCLWKLECYVFICIMDQPANIVVPPCAAKMDLNSRGMDRGPLEVLHGVEQLRFAYMDRTWHVPHTTNKIKISGIGMPGWWALCCRYHEEVCFVASIWISWPKVSHPNICFATGVITVQFTCLRF